MMSLLPSTEHLLLHRLARAQAEDRVPSLVAGLWRRADLLWSAGRGRTGTSRPDAGTQYRIGSISKTFCAVLVLRLRDESTLSLTDRVDRFVDGTPFGDRTLTQLLSHGGGVAAEGPGGWWERSVGRDWAELAGLLSAADVKHPAGRRFHYSNVGTAALGRVVEVVRGRPWYDVLRAEVLDPLGLRRTTFLPEEPYAQGFAVHPYVDLVLAEPHTDTAAMAPAGQLWSTVADLARWGAFLRGDLPGTEDVLDTATREQMRHPVHVEDADEWVEAYGLGLQVFRLRGRRLIGHGGSMPGFLAGLLVDEADGSGAATLANTTAGLTGGLGLDLLDLLDKYEPALPEEWVPMPVPAASRELLGSWFWGPRPHVLAALSGGLLDLRIVGEGRASRFVSQDDGSWRGLEGYYAGETLRAVRGPDGTVRQLDLGSFCFTRTPYDPRADVPGGIDEAGWQAPS